MVQASDAILDAANRVIVTRGIGAVSTREVAQAAGVTLSQIHYYFGSKQKLILAVFKARNDQLLERQQRMFEDPALSIADRWQKACEHLDEDLASGYVRTLMELWSLGWSDPEIAEVVRAGIEGWQNLIGDVVREAETAYGPLGPFSSESLAALVGSAFIGVEAFLLLDFDTGRVPVRRALDDVGKVIRQFEATTARKG
jgi:AcrR family transcriptional regulator